MKHVMTILSTAAALALTVGIPSFAQASIISAANPGLSDEIGARIRWGGTGFEASLWDADVSASPGFQTNHNPTMNPIQSPVWSVQLPHNFQITFNSSTGIIDLSVDFNRDGDFGETGEYASRNTFVAPGMTDYTGYGFNYLHISGNETGSTARSRIENLVINGSNLGTLTPGGRLLDTWWQDSSGNPLDPITITGQIRFLTSGTAQERPSWNFAFVSPEVRAQVAEPGVLALLGCGLIGLATIRRRRA